MTTTTFEPQAALPADWRDILALTKPRVMSLVVFTGLAGLLAAPGVPPPGPGLPPPPAPPRGAPAAGLGLPRIPGHGAGPGGGRRAQPRVGGGPRRKEARDRQAPAPGWP